MGRQGEAGYIRGMNGADIATPERKECSPILNREILRDRNDKGTAR